MSSVSLRHDTLIEIATFLVRRWSENDQISVEFSTKKTNETRMKEHRVSLIPFSDSVSYTHLTLPTILLV